MSSEDYAQIYRVLNALTPIPEDEIEKIHKLFRQTVIPKEGYFVVAGKVPEQIGFVLSGLLRSYYLSDSGNEFTMSFFLENEFVTSYSAALLNTESKIWIQAIEETTMLVASFKSFYSLLDTHPCWQIIGRKMAEASFLKKEQREIDFLSDDAETRYQHFLERYPGIEKRVKQHYIASYLGIAAVSLSRIRAKSVRRYRQKS